MSMQSVNSVFGIGDSRMNASFVFRNNPEIVRLISHFLSRIEDVASFGLTNRRVHSIVLGASSTALSRFVPRNPFPVLSIYAPMGNTSRTLLGPTHGNHLTLVNTPIGLRSYRIGPLYNTLLGSTHENPSSQNADYYGNFVQSENRIRHEIAIQNNIDGASYLKSVIDEHVQTLPQNKKDKFKKRIEEFNPKLFVEIPRLAVEKAISSSTPLTESNTPRFMHAHLKQLEQLRQKQTQLLPNDLWKECCNIATSLSREADCIASIQKAFQ